MSERRNGRKQSRRLRRLTRYVYRCAYCGVPIDRGIACHAHRDLPALDPHYSRSSRMGTGN